MLRFPLAMPLRDSGIYFRIFETGEDFSEETMSKIVELSITFGVEDIVNNRGLISVIASEVFGIRIQYIGGEIVADFAITEKTVEKIESSSAIGRIVRDFIDPIQGKESGFSENVLITRDKIEINSEMFFENSNFFNGVYNIICVYIVLIAKDKGILKSQIEE